MKSINKTWLQTRLSSCQDPDPTKLASLRRLATCLGFESSISVTSLITITHELKIPFQFGIHNLTFGNFTDGIPSWDTYRQTFGSAEIWHEIADPIFGHPFLTASYFVFYKHFLKGKANDGLATGFCTSLASLVADNFWQGKTDTTTITKASVHELLTAVHGKLLSKESLLTFHDQGREGAARVEKSFREIENTFLHGIDRRNAPLLFFIPSGAAWDEGYFERLGDSHCVMPYRLEYPNGGPTSFGVGAAPTTDPDGVEIYVWDCNKPNSKNCKLVFKRVGDGLEFEYFPGGSAPKFTSQQGITLGMMTNGNYMLDDHDLPFSGPLGFTRFIIDFILSPADLQVTNSNGMRTGNFGGKILAEIPNSHPCYLIKGAYMLPEQIALTRKIVGHARGMYKYASITPNGNSVSISEISTDIGQEDILSISQDSTHVHFTPANEKAFSIGLTRKVGDQMRAIVVTGASGEPAADMHINVSPDMSTYVMGNKGKTRNVDVKSFASSKSSITPFNKELKGVHVPSNHNLTVTVRDWSSLNLEVKTQAVN